MFHRRRAISLSLSIVLLVVIVVRAATNTVTDSNVKDLYFSLVVSSAPTLNTTGIISDVDRALELINSDAAVLPGYRLHYSRVLDSHVRYYKWKVHAEPGRGLIHLVAMMHGLGPGRSCGLFGPEDACLVPCCLAGVPCLLYNSFMQNCEWLGRCRGPSGHRLYIPLYIISLYI